LWWTKWQWDRIFSEYFGFPCQFHCTGAPLKWKGRKTSINIFIFLIGLHNKPSRLRCFRSICYGALQKKKARSRVRVRTQRDIKLQGKGRERKLNYEKRGI
jgi:hypothetical protein